MGAFDRMRRELDSKMVEDREAEIGGEMLYCFLGASGGCISEVLEIKGNPP